MKSKVAIIKTSDRAAGVPAVIDLLGAHSFSAKSVLLKPNFNTSDPYPGSTHNDTLVSLISKLKDMGASGITIAERSGPQDTADVLKKKGIYKICKDLGVGLINLEELPNHDWIRVRPDNSHWRNGFEIARPFIESDCIVSTCCLKTHGFGGVFTISLKLAIGMTHKRNMAELHSSIRSMRKMIAEVNTAFAPSLIFLDAIEAFTDGGPMRGEKKHAGLLLAGTDRVAIDAAGIAILKHLGSNRAVMEKKIFQQEQISSAVELGLGIGSPEEIEFVTGDDESEEYSERLKKILMQG